MTRSSNLLAGGNDTIAAISTATGTGAIAIVRLSGHDALAILHAITRIPLPPPRVASLRSIFADSPILTTLNGGYRIDQSLVTVFPAPNSYTGEDVVELSVHGGSAVPAMVMERLIQAGARQALPGEFTRRAVLNGKMDLLQAEAVVDLVSANSRGAVRAAVEQLDGGLTRRIIELRVAILEVEALVAYEIDFPEEDDGPIGRDRAIRASGEVLSRLSNLLATARTGELVRDGALVVIAGAPNAGKSSLFNAMLGQKRALVTDIPGTTRDAIEAVIEVDPWAVRLVDTAGLRETAEIVERLGIEVAEEYASRADLILACGETMDSVTHAVLRVRERTSAPTIAVLTKCDLVTHGNYNWRQVVSEDRSTQAPWMHGAYQVSAVTGEGMQELLQGISSAISQIHHVPKQETPLLLRARHERAVSEAASEMRSFLQELEQGELPTVIIATHLHTAARALESLIGSVEVDDVLDVVFSNFCIGK